MLCRRYPSRTAIDIIIGTATHEVGQAASDGAESIFVRIDGTDGQSELLSGDSGKTACGKMKAANTGNTGAGLFKTEPQT